MGCVPPRADGVWIVMIVNGRIISVVGGRGGGCESVVVVVVVDLVVYIRRSVRRRGGGRGIQRFNVVRQR